MTNPLSYHLLKVEWQLYVTLTFGANWSHKKTRNKVDRIFSWLRRIVHHHTGSRALDGVPFVVAEELGEMNERYHVHILLGGLPRKPSVSDCFAMEWLWAESFRGGHAKIRPYIPTLRGVGYVMKSLDLSDLRRISSEEKRDKAEALAGVHVGRTTTIAGANSYEVGKIGDQDLDGACMVMVSRRCYGLLAGIATSRGRRRERSRAFFQRRSKRHATPDTIEKQPSRK